MELLIQQYGALGVGLIVLFQVINTNIRIVKLEMKLENFNDRITALEKGRKK
jgi:hypothetical protein